MWPSRIALLLEGPPEPLVLATAPDDEHAFSGRYLRIDGVPYALGRRIARGDEAFVFELVDLRLGYCAGVIKLCRYKPGTEHYARWAVPRRRERNPYSHLPDVELHPARLVPVSGGVVKQQPYIADEPEAAWAAHGPIVDVLRLKERDPASALALADSLLNHHGPRAVLLEAKGMVLDRMDRLEEARDVLEDALERHVRERNAARLHTSGVLADVLHKLYERSIGAGGSTIQFRLPDGSLHAQTAFTTPEDAAADDELEDRAVFVLLEALADEPYFAGGLLRLGGWIVNAPAAIEAIHAVVAALRRIDPADPDVEEFAAHVTERYGPPREPAARGEAPEAPYVHSEADEHLARFDARYQPEPTRGRQAAARHDAALVHAAAGRLDEAEADLREAVSLDQDEVQHILMLAAVLAHKGDDGGARRVLEEATARFPDDARTYERLADVCFEREAYADAKLAYLRALHTEPAERWSVKLKLAETYRALDDRTAALRFHREAHADAPDEPAALVGLVQTLRALALKAGVDPTADEDFLEAYELLEEGLERFPTSASVHVCAAQSVLALQDYEDALELLRRAVELEPDHPFAAKFLSELEG